jgi:hypothetical protein
MDCAVISFDFISFLGRFADNPTSTSLTVIQTFRFSQVDSVPLLAEKRGKVLDLAKVVKTFRFSTQPSRRVSSLDRIVFPGQRNLFPSLFNTSIESVRRGTVATDLVESIVWHVDCCGDTGHSSPRRCYMKWTFLKRHDHDSIVFEIFSHAIKIARNAFPTNPMRMERP